ncbi:MAG: response regulator [Patescibacteria group bacterium]|nr:response regulator [Patescibacteria group bacterium]
MSINQKKKIILIVEDEQALQDALKMKFEKEGVEVLTAGTGEEALEVLKKKRPVLISLDILLPKMNGLEVLKKIRADSRLRDLPVVVVSVSGGQEKIRQAFSLGIVDYLVKSEYKIENIVKKIMAIMEKFYAEKNYSQK